MVLSIDRLLYCECIKAARAGAVLAHLVVLSLLISSDVQARFSRKLSHSILTKRRASHFVNNNFCMCTTLFRSLLTPLPEFGLPASFQLRDLLLQHFQLLLKLVVFGWRRFRDARGGRAFRPVPKCGRERLEHSFGPGRHRGEYRWQSMSAANLLLQLVLIIKKRLQCLIKILFDEVFHELIVHPD